MDAGTEADVILLDLESRISCVKFASIICNAFISATVAGTDEAIDDTGATNAAVDADAGAFTDEAIDDITGATDIDEATDEALLADLNSCTSFVKEANILCSACISGGGKGGSADETIGATDADEATCLIDEATDIGEGTVADKEATGAMDGTTGAYGGATGAIDADEEATGAMDGGTGADRGARGTVATVVTEFAIASWARNCFNSSSNRLLSAAAADCDTKYLSCISRSCLFNS